LLRLTGFLWGLFEATFFFLVPDVYLTAAVFKSGARKVIPVFLCCLAGALLGGGLVYFLAFWQPVKIFTWLEHVPGISGRLIQQVQFFHGSGSVFKGMFQGIPYKLFAAAWREKKESFFIFILISLAARSARFILSIAVAAFLNGLGMKLVKGWRKWRWAGYSFFWFSVYYVYFNIYGW
jgi:hypothetical protein